MPFPHATLTETMPTLGPKRFANLETQIYSNMNFLQPWPIRWTGWFFVLKTDWFFRVEISLQHIGFSHLSKPGRQVRRSLCRWNPCATTWLEVKLRKPNEESPWREILTSTIQKISKTSDPTLKLPLLRWPDSRGKRMKPWGGWKSIFWVKRPCFVYRVWYHIAYGQNIIRYTERFIQNTS